MSKICFYTTRYCPFSRCDSHTKAIIYYLREMEDSLPPPPRPQSFLHCKAASSFLHIAFPPDAVGSCLQRELHFMRSYL